MKKSAKIAETGYNNSVMLEIHKVGNGGPQIYENTSIEEFLSRANKSAVKLAEMIKNYQKITNSNKSYLLFLFPKLCCLAN